MIDIDQIQTILEIHGESLNSPRETIRRILESAEYPEDEIQQAFLLCPPLDASVSRKDGLHKLFRADVSLRPAEISALLGIQVRVTELPERLKAAPKKTSYKETIATCAITLILAVIGLAFAMYTADIGPFHKTVTASFAK